MKLKNLIEFALDKNNFNGVNDYLDFCEKYLEFIKDNLQAVIVSKTENNYCFFQYRKEGSFNVTRPINSDIMISLEDFDETRALFQNIIKRLRKERKPILNVDGAMINKIVYTSQQTIGAVLDALPANKSNFARKINGDLFERHIFLILREIGIDVHTGTIPVPVDINGKVEFKMNYQHDLIIKANDITKAIGSVKTSSKDRLDKIFIDKFLYNKLTEKNTPHFAIFLNDVQRKGKEGSYGINATFLSGHFKGYTIKLNPLDGVYYIDIRPNMVKEEFLKDHIFKFDRFLLNDIWKFNK